MKKKGIPREAANHLPQTKHISSNPQMRDKHQGYLSFSFKYFKQSPPEFEIERKEAQYFLKVIDRLTLLSSLTATELRTQPNKTLRCHSIKWHDTTQKQFGIPDETQLVDEPWQFSISANAYGRVVGFFIDSVFYIVWFDHNQR